MNSKSISQSRAEVYNALVKQWNDFYKEEPTKLVLYLHKEKHMTAEDIGKILGVTGQVIRDKYINKEVSK